jgi:hypothetical protein
MSPAVSGLVRYLMLQKTQYITSPVTDLMNEPQRSYFSQQTVDSARIITAQEDTNNTTGVWVTLGLGVAYSTGGPRPGV